MTLLLTGYEPFGDHDRNPTEEVARELDGQEVAGREIVGRVLPVEFDRAAEEMRDLVQKHDPETVVATGLAAGRAAVSVERVGVNVADCAGIADNADAEPRNERIRTEGADSESDTPPAAYFATLPVVEVVEDLLEADIPARVSNTAGTHLCNNVLYQTRHYLETAGRGAEIPMGFVHLPLTPEGAAKKAREGEAASGGGVEPSVALETQLEAIRRTFETTVEPSQ
ncbi:pyroglutamyl-peptidase I family protein [Halorussus ruber]|uniref:pyroglutamyl-peptidase I family protein n=1 Tax=Halorussus ruber TaxID=1126238 RepID=UPI00109331C3|nr:peptidase [Halorussus ruber]